MRFDILPAASGEDSYCLPLGSTRWLRRVPPTTALLQRRTTKRLYFGPYPALGLVDAKEFRMTDSDRQALYPRPETPRLYGQEW
jgi:hypothetical protein